MSKVDSALSIKTMPKGKTWMTISYEVADKLTREELCGIIKEIVLSRGQEEHNNFYAALEVICGEKRALEVIEGSK